jgi:Tol biopolymer transport system component
LLAVGLTASESTGLTHVAASVIRIVRGDGTLVVEIDDPNIQVLVDGDEIAITGAGPKELRLRPGQHELKSVRDGRLFGTQNITITRDGRQAVKVAREAAAAVPVSPTNRLVWPDCVDDYSQGEPSPDGTYVAYTDWVTGDIGVYDLGTGKSRRLTNQGWPEYGLYPIFSPDSRQVAYSWTNKEKINELRIVGLDGSEARALFPNNERDTRAVVPCDWSADGKYILAHVVTTEVNKLALISVKGGSLRDLKTFDRGNGAKAEGKIKLSPDGRHVVYNSRPQKGSNQRDIVLLPTDGSGEIPLVEHPADDFVLGWAPDGKRVVFASNRGLSMGIWLIRVADGKAQGAAELVKTEMGQFQELGLTPSGTFYYGLLFGGQNVYTASLDPAQAKLENRPAVAIQRGEGFNWAPCWAPDGRYLACQSRRPVGGTNIYIRSSETKEVRELVPVPTTRFNVHSLNWSPDGLSLLGGNGARVDVETGAVTRLLRSTRNALYSQWAPDGKAAYYLRSDVDGIRHIVRQDVVSGAEQELYKTPDHTQWLTLSPDGQQLAFATAGALKVLPATGGEPRELTKVAYHITTVAWTPDSQHLFFGASTVPEQENWHRMRGELWRISAAGGESQKVAEDVPAMLHLRIHPDGRQIAFSAHGPQPDKSEVWVLENFLPPMKGSDATAVESGERSGTADKR